ncbi:MAG: phosphoserine phosphatase SerB [Acetobacter sp.]|nr:phosphoserine phosphatase SerB [Acetobacter sp.]
MTSLILTLVAERETTCLTPALISLARDILSTTEEMTVLSPEEAVDIPCNATAWDKLSTLRHAFKSHAIDPILTPAKNRQKRLLLSDMDSTIVANETLDDLAQLAGIGEKIAAITARSMNGELDFATSLNERVALLRGYPAHLLKQAWEKIRLNTGAITLVRTMRAHGAKTVLVSGGFTYFTAQVAALCGFDEHYANTLQLSHNNTELAGTVQQPVLGAESKFNILQECAHNLSLPLSDTLAIGDGANDLPMLRTAGLGLAFHAKPVVRQTITAQINHTSLRTVLFAQGYPASVFTEE